MTINRWSIVKSRDGDDAPIGYFAIEAVELPPVGKQVAPTEWPVLVELPNLQASAGQDALDKAMRGTQKGQRTAFEATVRTILKHGPIPFDDWVESVIKPTYPKNKNPRDRGRELVEVFVDRKLVTETDGKIDVEPWVRDVYQPDDATRDGTTDSSSLGVFP